MLDFFVLAEDTLMLIFGMIQPLTRQAGGWAGGGGGDCVEMKNRFSFFLVGGGAGFLDERFL